LRKFRENVDRDIVTFQQISDLVLRAGHKGRTRRS